MDTYHWDVLVTYQWDALGVSFEICLRRRKDVRMRRCCYVLLRRPHNVPIRCCGEVPLRCLGDVLSRRRWVFHWDVTATSLGCTERRHFDVTTTFCCLVGGGLTEGPYDLQIKLVINSVINIRWWRCLLPSGPSLALLHPNSWLENHFVLLLAKIIKYTVFKKILVV